MAARSSALDKNGAVEPTRAGPRAVTVARTLVATCAACVTFGASAALAAAPDASRGALLQRADFVDYGLIAAGLAMIGGARLFDGPLAAKIGPVYDAKDPAAVLDARFGDRVGRRYNAKGDGEIVPTSAATVGVGAVFGAIAMDAFGHQLAGDRYGARGSHDAVVGFAEGAALTLGVVELLKPLVGRLRPDFQDRARRYHCHPPAGDVRLDAASCVGVEPLDGDADEARWALADGRKSFPSGHSAASFFAATYAASYLGGRYVWGEQATDTTRAVGLLAGGLLLGAAGFVATTRYDDGHHNMTDIVAGASLGVAFATFSYWRRFDSHGRPRRALPGAGAQLDVTGRGLSVRVAF